MEFGAGNTGFMLMATALVMLMTPGLAFFLWGARREQERGRRDDAQLRVARCQHHSVVRSRIFTVVQRG